MTEKTQRKKFDVLIIGGGVVGTAVARSLAKLKLKTALVEKEVELAFGTTKANSGIVHAGFHNEPGSLKAILCVKGCDMFPQVCEELDVPFKENGVLMVATSDRELPLLHKFYEQGIQNGVRDLELIDRDRVFELEPNLSRYIVAGLFAPHGGIVSPFELAIYQGVNAEKNGVEIFLDAAVENVVDRGNYIEVATKKGTFEAALVVNCAGLFADDIAQMVGDTSFAIRPRKGEEYLLDKRVGNLVTSTIFPLPSENSKGILVIPTAHGNLMIGPTALEMQEREDLSTTQEGLEVIYQSASKLVKGISRRDIIASFAGVRAASDRGDFVIEFSKVAPRLLNVAGIESPGLTAAPAIGEMVLEMIKDWCKDRGIPVEENHDFNPRLPKRVRLQDIDDPRLEEMIAKDRRYAHAVCRCEMVSEAEIVEAIQNGARTLDGIKLRTRAGMGRCQGGFCTPKVLQIMARELNVPITSITKRGGDSVIVPYKTKELI